MAIGNWGLAIGDWEIGKLVISHWYKGRRTFDKGQISIAVSFFLIQLYHKSRENLSVTFVLLMGMLRTNRENYYSRPKV
jgi:hypothetical protein